MHFPKQSHGTRGIAKKRGVPERACSLPISSLCLFLASLFLPKGELCGLRNGVSHPGWGRLFLISKQTVELDAVS